MILNNLSGFTHLQTNRTNIRTYKKQNYTASVSPSLKVSFKGIKGLGDAADELIKLAKKAVSFASKKNNNIKNDWDSTYQMYLDAVKRRASESEKRKIIAKLKEVRLQAEVEAFEIRRHELDLSNRIDTASLQNSLNQHVVKGFGFGKIAGYEDIIKILNNEFISKIKAEREGAKVNIPSSFIFFGPKGNGKTTSALAIAEETGCKIQKLRYLPFECSKEKYCDKVENMAKDCEANFLKDGRKIFFMDEFTSFFNGDEGVKNKFLSIIKDCSEKFHCTFFGTTNFLSAAGEQIEKINPVLVAFEPPNKINMMQILRYYAQDIEANSINYSKLADELSQWAKDNGGTLNISHLKNIVTGAASKSAKITADDILDFAKNDFDKGILMTKESLDIFEKDYEKFMK